MKTVPPRRESDSPYLACSAIVQAGSTDSADVIPAILCIAFETCQRLGLIPDFVLAVETPLTPETPTAVEEDLDSDIEGQATDSSHTSDTSTIDDDGSFRPDSGSSDYSPQAPTGKRPAKRAASADTQPKRIRSEKDEQVGLLDFTIVLRNNAYEGPRSL